MLSSLHIENIAVIKELEIEFDKGFTVLTGETGAGKSIIIDSIGLIMGTKLSKDLIRSGEERALVTAVFGNLPGETLDALAELDVTPDEDGIIYITRSVTAEGKSTVKINGRTVPASLHRSVGQLLINIHGQHENQILLSPETHIKLIDKYACLDEKLKEYGVYYSEMCTADRERKKLMSDEREKAQRIDMLTYQIDEIKEASLTENEDEKLENELKILKNAKQIAKHATTVYRALYKNEKGGSAARLLQIARSSLDEMADVMPDAAKYSDRLYDMEYELEAIAKDALSVIPGGDDPERRISEIEDRLDVIRKLKRKYGSSVTEVLEYLHGAELELEAIKSSEKNAERYEKIYNEARKNAEKIASEISRVRKEYSEKLSDAVCRELSFLDMNKVRFAVDLKKNTDQSGVLHLGPDGFDNVEFVISTNPGEPLKPLAKIASGGELSRIMLAVKCVLADAEGIPTLVFDEVDTGISGKTSQKIGIKLAELSRSPQVFCITHSAQIAAFADNHYKIYKTEEDGRSSTHVSLLSYDERVSEIARIMGGAEITPSVIRSAEEMIEYSEKFTFEN